MTTEWRAVRIGCIVVFSFILGIKAAAQTNLPVIVGAAYQDGFVIVHTSKIRHLQGVQPLGAELNLQYQTTGHKAWHQLYRYPRLGISLIGLDYRNLILGKSLATSVYISKPVISRAKDRVNVRLGTGIAYFSQYFDQKTNPTNNVISAPLNAVIQTRVEYERKVTNSLAVVTAVGINHYSNGGNSKPNLGINIGTLTVGLNYNSFREFVPEPQNIPPVDKSISVLVSGSAGIKQRNDFDTLRYTIKSVSIAARRQVNPKSALLLGVEGFYDPSLIPRRNWDPRVKPGATPDIKRVALNFGHELLMGKLGFGTYAGWYAYRPYKSDAPFYQRLEMRYPITRHIYVAAGLKLHDIIKADVIEYRLGFRFGKKRRC
jgi:hypothetical protein